MDMSRLAQLPLWLVPFIFSLCFHEFCHAWMANRLGDNTSKFMGRLSMNPAVHVDPIGTLAFPIIGFLTGFPMIGWAKPVMTNSRNFKDPIRDEMYVAAAGPFSNLFLAVCFTVVAHFLNQDSSGLSRAGFDQPLFYMAIYGLTINVFLAFFNLLPIPPLDGGHILKGLIPSLSRQIDQFARYGFIVLLILMYTGAFKILLAPAYAIINVLMSYV